MSKPRPTFRCRVEPLEKRLLLAATTFGNSGQPWAVPLTGTVHIEAENFNQGGVDVGYHVVPPGNSGGPYRGTDLVNIQPSAAASNGYDVESIDPGEWLEYTVSVPKSGIYTINLRTACATSGGTTVTITSAADSSRTVAIPGTGDAHTFATTTTQLELWAGTQVIHVQAVHGGFTFDYLEVGTRSATPQPYTSDWQPWTIASNAISWIESENYDRGGEGVAYHDTTTSNQGGKYRLNEAIDIEGPQTNAGGTYNIGYVNSGEWLDYTINVQQAGQYQLILQAATPNDAKTADIAFLSTAGVVLADTGSLPVPNTGGFQTYTNVTATITLPAGVQVMKVQATTSSFNMDYVSLQPVSTLGGEQAYNSGSRNLPPLLPQYGTTRIEAENYDTGGEGVAYHKVNTDITKKPSTATSGGNPFRATDLVATQNSGTGIAVVYWKPGEWTQYIVDASFADTYELTIGYARGDSGNSNFTISVNGVTQVSNLALPSDSSWTTYTTVTTAVTLTAGTNIIRFTTSVGQINYDYFELTRSTTFGNSGAAWHVAATGATTILAANFDTSPGSYYDTTAGNSAASNYRPGTDVDIEPTTDTGGDVDITNIAAGESLTYTIRADLTGYYFINLRVSNPAGGSLQLLFDGTNNAGTITLPATANYQTWTTYQVRTIFQSGLQTMQVVAVSSGFDLHWIKLQKDPNTAAVLAAPAQLGSYAAEPPDAALNSVSDLYSVVYDPQYNWINRPAGAPVPSNKWWSNILDSQFAGNLWPYPLEANTSASGVKLTYFNALNNTAGNIAATGGQTIRVSGPTDTFTRNALVNYGDWTLQFRMEQSATSYMDVTIGRGIPYAWFEFTALAPFLHIGGTWTAYNASGAALSGTFTTDQFEINKSGQVFGVFAPPGTTFTPSGDGYTVTFAGSSQFLAVAALPDATAATLALFYQHAYAIPRNSTYDWTYSAAAGQVATTWNLATQALVPGASTDTLQGWLPDDYQDIVSGPPLVSGYQYVSINGPILLSVGHSFTIVQPTAGLNFMLPAPQSIGGTADYNAAQMAYYLQQEVTTSAGKPVYGNDTYWGGKDLQQYAEYALMAQQLGSPTYATYVNALKTALTDWFTYTPGETAHYFAYYPDAKALIGFNPSYGSEDFTDNHFHYGYFTSSAGVLALLNPQWAQQYGAMATMVAEQYANWDRSNTQFPFLRTFDPWSGHSYAGGMGDGRGNNQESTSEAIQSWQGLVLLGSALGNQAMVACGMMGYTEESKAELNYWFDAPHQNLFPSGYARSNVGINYDASKSYATVFGANPEYILGIEGLPLWPSLDFLGEYPAAMATDVNMMLQQRTVYYNNSADNTWASFENGTNANDWLNVNLGIVAQYDPQSAAVQYAQMWTNQTPTGKEDTTGLYYYQVQSYRTYGLRDWSYHLSVPLGGVYGTTGQRTYMAYNPTTAAETVQVFDASGNVIDSFLALPQQFTVVRAAIWQGGGGTNNWSTGGNWKGGAAPVAGQHLTFPAPNNSSAVNNLTAGTIFAGLALDANNFTLSGNQIILDPDGGGGISNSGTSNVVTLPLGLNSDTIIASYAGQLSLQGAIATGGHLLTVDSESPSAITIAAPISGSGQLIKQGGGILTLSAANTYNGGTVVSGGKLVVTSPGSLPSGGSITVGSWPGQPSPAVPLETPAITAPAAIIPAATLTPAAPIAAAVNPFARDSAVTTLLKNRAAGLMAWQPQEERPVKLNALDRVLLEYSRTR
jgi:autotransporter-associated beta strand protein